MSVIVSTGPNVVPCSFPLLRQCLEKFPRQPVTTCSHHVSVSAQKEHPRASNYRLLDTRVSQRAQVKLGLASTITCTAQLREAGWQRLASNNRHFHLFQLSQHHSLQTAGKTHRLPITAWLAAQNPPPTRTSHPCTTKVPKPANCLPHPSTCICTRDDYLIRLHVRLSFLPQPGWPPKFKHKQNNTLFAFFEPRPQSQQALLLSRQLQSSKHSATSRHPSRLLDCSSARRLNVSNSREPPFCVAPIFRRWHVLRMSAPLPLASASTVETR